MGIWSTAADRKRYELIKEQVSSAGSGGANNIVT